jgi:hypothetical protein
MRYSVSFLLFGVALGFATLVLLPGGREPAPVRDEPGPVAGRAAPVPRLVSGPSEHGVSPSDPVVADHAGDDDTLDDDALEALEPAFDVEAESGEPDTEGLPPSGTTQRRIERLVAGGLEPERAAAIVEQEAALRLAAFYDEFEATGTIRAFNAGGAAARTARLREALGDAEYERYLEASGSPTYVRIGSLDASSPAADAGFEPGDKIVSYAGERVFNFSDLHALMLAGRPGETVPTTVIRDGQPLELYVTRGPLGLVEGGLDAPEELP